MSELQVTTSAELMENYLQADVLVPQDAFVAIQTNAGAALLFSIGTAGALNLTLEVPGKSHGWRLIDLSGEQIKKDFPSGATCKTFAAAQAIAAAGGTAEIHMAMVLNDGTNDHLYISMANSDADLGWVDNPVWIACPYNASGTTPPTPFEIAGVFISEATDGEYVVVDIIRNPSEPVAVLSRFYLDLTTPTDPTWKPHDLATDVQAAGYDSCLGRAAHAYGVDGLYTKGQIGPRPELLYTPLYNAFDPKMPPAPSRLALPGGLLADAIAAARNADNTSDFYVAASGGLYYFASSNQKDEAVGELVVQNDLLTGVRKLYAYASDGTITLWGLNGNDAVFYLTCPQAEVATPGAWNIPLTIVSGVDAISPYIDRAYSANTFFAHDGNGLVKFVKTPSTGIWSRRPILLPPADIKKDATPVSTYTTHVQVSDANGKAVAGVAVSLTTTSVTSVYINHLYYIVGPTPIEVVTDELGTVTVVEQTHALAGSRLTATIGQQQVPEINPMQSAFKRNCQYDTVTSLQGAQIVSKDGTTRPLIPSGTSDDDLKRVAYSNQCAATAYDGLKPTNTLRPRPTLQAATAGVPASLVAAGFDDSILVDLGDLFSWLESGIESVIDFVEDAAEDAWYFVATIAGQVYHGILDCVEKIVAAVTWIYNAIKVLIEDIIAFLEFLFGWQDIITTHRVLKNVFLQLAQYEVDQIESIKDKLGGLFETLIEQIDSWADLPGFDQTSSGTSAANPPLAGQNSAPTNLGVHHFQGNAANAASSAELAAFDGIDDIFKDLIDLMEREEDALTAAFDEIKTQIIDQFDDLSVSEIVKRFVAIVADTILKLAENAIVTLLELVAQLVEGLIDILSASLDIPILSWLYNLLTGDDLSFLDLICLVAAIPVTLIYKATADAAPFPSGDSFTDGLISAGSFAEIQALFQLSASQATALEADDDPTLDEAKLKTFGIVTGICALAGSFVLIITTNIQRALDAAGISIAKAKTLATISCIGNIAYVSPNIATLINAKTDNWYSDMNNTVTGISILKGMAAIPAATSQNKSVPIAFASVETIINTVWNVPVIANIAVNKDVWDSTYKSLIPESIGNFGFNLGGMLELPITLSKDPDTKLALIAGQAVLMLVYGVFMVIAGGIYEWAPDQHH